MNNVRTNNRFFVLIKEREFFRKPFYCLGVFKQATCVTFNKRYNNSQLSSLLIPTTRPTHPSTHPPTPLSTPLHSTPLRSTAFLGACEHNESSFLIGSSAFATPNWQSCQQDRPLWVGLQTACAPQDLRYASADNFGTIDHSCSHQLAVMRKAVCWLRAY